MCMFSSELGSKSSFQHLARVLNSSQQWQDDFSFPIKSKFKLMTNKFPACQPLNRNETKRSWWWWNLVASWYFTFILNYKANVLRQMSPQNGRNVDNSCFWTTIFLSWGIFWAPCSAVSYQLCPVFTFIVHLFIHLFTLSPVDFSSHRSFQSIWGFEPSTI